MSKSFLIFGNIPNNNWLFFLYSKTENVFSLNNDRLKMVTFQNKFYLYNQNSGKWKKNNTNSTNMPEKE